jgi:hypothetical protein
METIKNIASGAGGVVTGLACCACSVLPIVMLVYLGIYSFNNPDAAAWYGLSDGKQELFLDEAAGNAAGAKSLVDMHGRLVTWFLWGFCQMLAPLATALLATIGMAISPTVGSVLGTIGGCGVGCGGLAWWIAGIVWRFRSDGAFAVGDII